MCVDVSLGTIRLPDLLGQTSSSSNHYCCGIHQTETVAVAGRGNDLSVELSQWQGYSSYSGYSVIRAGAMLASIVLIQVGVPASSTRSAKIYIVV